MRPKPGHIFCLMGVVVLLCYGAQAQEAYPMEGTDGERDATYTPVDGEIGSHVRGSERESVEYAVADTSRRGAPVAAGRAGFQAGTAEKEAVQSGNQDSVLGFNFLYYIIQKFKMSDIVEK